jgi:hypothetical protein
MSKPYFFSNSQQLCHDINRDAADPSYRLSVCGYWTGLPAVGVDAAINWGNGFVYFFAGSRYNRSNTKTDQVESGSPLPIAGHWPGLTLDAIDGCINFGNEKAYFFRGSQYWRYDIKKDAVDPGFPLPIAGNWPGLFTSGVCAPVELGYAGCDRAGYPGDAAMGALWHNTSLRWCGFYLTPSPNQGAQLGWMTKLDFLVALGRGLAPIYVGEQQIKVCKTCSANPSTAKGATDAADAIRLATTAGFPAGSVIYLDIETGDKVNGPVRDYYQSWVAGILAEGFLPGVYCSYVTARQLKGFDSRPLVWVFNIGKYAAEPRPLTRGRCPLPSLGSAASSSARTGNWRRESAA